MLSKAQTEKVLNSRICPRVKCNGTKLPGVTFCHHDLMLLPGHMRTPNMIEQAVRYLDVRFKSIRNFGGGRKR